MKISNERYEQLSKVLSKEELSRFSKEDIPVPHRLIRGAKTRSADYIEFSKDVGAVSFIYEVGGGVVVPIQFDSLENAIELLCLWGVT